MHSPVYIITNMHEKLKIYTGKKSPKHKNVPVHIVGLSNDSKFLLSE